MDAGLAGAIGAGIPLILWEGSRLIARKYGRAKTLPERMDRIETVVVDMAEETSVQTDCLQATLEALQGQCNGNVTTALGNVRDMRAKREERYRKKAILQERAK